MATTKRASGRTVVAERSGSWGQARRLEFIDFRLLWEGQINRSDLTGFFGISVPQASLDLAKYLQLAPENVRYDRRQKIYQATPRFVPVLTTADSSRYLNQLFVVTTRVMPKERSFIGWYPHCDVVRLPTRQIRAAILFRVLLAIRQRGALVIEYQSLNRPEPTRRTISPHALAFDGFRWHARAFCHERTSFRDFVLARMHRVTKQTTSDIDPSDDTAWHTLVKLVLAPHPGLPPAQRSAIELDYDMKNGKTVLEARKALLFYTLRQLGLHEPQEPTPQAKQIVLSNRAEIEPHLKDL